MPCQSADLPCPAELYHILGAIDLYFMQQIALVWPGHIEELQDCWAQLLGDVMDLVSTVGMDAAEALIDRMIGEEWRRGA